MLKIHLNYERYYRYVRSAGEKQSPRGHKTWAVYDMIARFDPLFVPRRRGDNPAIGIMEGLQFIAGVFDHGAIERVAPNARLDLFTGQSAYGPRVGEQDQWVIDTILHDHESRRAQIILGFPNEPLEDRPCTTSLQFQARGDRLHLTVNMRSSDAIWGLPYDLIQFNMMNTALARCLELDPGYVVMHLGNAHIYEATHYQGRWGYDRLRMPQFTRLYAWKEWAKGLIKNATHQELVDTLLVTRVSPKELENE